MQSDNPTPPKGADISSGRSGTPTDISSEGLLRAFQITKSFGGVKALQEVDFSVRGQEVHALLGGNGSGKSTLTKILSGVINADAGRVAYKGAEQDARTISPGYARSLGVRVVHQQDTTFGELTVAENLALGSTFLKGRLGRIQWREQFSHAEHLLRQHGVPARARDRIENLRPAIRTLIAIVRALSDSGGNTPRILFLDEPTAALPAKEAAWLIDVLRGLAESGHAIVFISHRTREVLDVADQVTILKDGSVIGALPRSELDEHTLVHMISGETANGQMPIEKSRQSRASAQPHARLDVQSLQMPNGPISFTVNEGEIVGIAGLVGSGRTNILRGLAGVEPVPSKVCVDGATADVSTSANALQSGIVLLPASRDEAAFANHSVTANAMAAVVSRYWSRGWLNDRRARARASAMINELSVRTPSVMTPFSNLSGGNQQKVLLGRCLEFNPSVLLLNEPTQGVDVGARRELHKIITKSAQAGMSVLMVSSDFDELASLCDRVLFLHDSQIVAEVPGQDLTEDDIATRVANTPTGVT